MGIPVPAIGMGMLVTTGMGMFIAMLWCIGAPWFILGWWGGVLEFRTSRLDFDEEIQTTTPASQCLGGSLCSVCRYSVFVLGEFSSAVNGSDSGPLF